MAVMPSDRDIDRATALTCVFVASSQAVQLDDRTVHSADPRACMGRRGQERYAAATPMFTTGVCVVEFRARRERSFHFASSSSLNGRHPSRPLFGATTVIRADARLSSEKKLATPESPANHQPTEAIADPASVGDNGPFRPPKEDRI